ncbi:hypothetical protein P8452_46634 [Trifolium repens]|nr:hypothetical protein P8452_46634 [Trifolium repens]
MTKVHEIISTGFTHRRRSYTSWEDMDSESCGGIMNFAEMVKNGEQFQINQISSQAKKFRFIYSLVLQERICFCFTSCELKYNVFPAFFRDVAVHLSSLRFWFDCARTHGILLEVVQILSDLLLFIKKAHVSSDGRWFMDVFHVTDQNGNKLLTDESVLKYIEQLLSSIHNGKTNHRNGLTALELKRTDRVGLLSEMFAVLTELQCDVVEAKVWIHNGRIASLIYVKVCNTGTSIEDYQKINRLEARLRYVLQGDSHVRSATTSLSDVINPERRLHQMMFSDAIGYLAANTGGDLAANIVYVTDAIGYLLGFDFVCFISSFHGYSYTIDHQ